jgi:putative ABC transport system permease protein
MHLLSEFKEGLAISMSALRANKMRSGLTTLGIIIGVVTVTLMGTAIQGLDRAFVKSVSVIGTDVIFVERFNWFTHTRDAWLKMQKRRPFTLDQVHRLRNEMKLARAIAPVAESQQTIQFQRRHSDNVAIIGTTDEFQQTGSISVGEGRFLSPGEIEGGRPACVLGYQVATNLFPQGSAIGNKVMIGARACDVVGVLEKLGSFIDGESMDNQAIVPIAFFIGAYSSLPDYTVEVKAMSPEQLDDMKEELRMTLRKIRHVSPGDDDDFAMNQQDQFVEMFRRITGRLAAVGLFITGLSLFVGGIGIMNIMFVSVTERTREIGIRKAIGARRRTILVQFLIEAAAICLLGGMLAVALAYPVTLLMQKYLPASLSVPVVIVALLVSIITGVISGFLPAWRASQMNVVDALRSE